MRFSDNGYYIEKYVKCANCGMLVYGKGQTHEVAAVIGAPSGPRFVLSATAISS
jgi:hypothetical protein